MVSPVRVIVKLTGPACVICPTPDASAMLNIPYGSPLPRTEIVVEVCSVESLGVTPVFH